MSVFVLIFLFCFSQQQQQQQLRQIPPQPATPMWPHAQTHSYFSSSGGIPTVRSRRDETGRDRTDGTHDYAHHTAGSHRPSTIDHRPRIPNIVETERYAAFIHQPGLLLGHEDVRARVYVYVCACYKDTCQDRSYGVCLSLLSSHRPMVL